VIKTFADKRTAALFAGRYVKRLPGSVAERAKRKLDLIDAAASIAFLRVPPGNRLEALSGDRAGQYSIRVNDQWRICFRWLDGNAFDVEFCDYH
jgi:proteic killer suppression protein